MFEAPSFRAVRMSQYHASLTAWSVSAVALQGEMGTTSVGRGALLHTIGVHTLNGEYQS